MTKEEQLRIYSAYLPYDLKLQHKYEKAKHKGETVLRSWIKPLEPLDLGCFFPRRKDSFDWKPILYDLSYLTKEIEHEGNMIVPVEELAKLHVNWDEFDYDLKVIAEVKRQFNLKITWKRKNTTDEYYSDDLFIMTERWHLNRYWVVQKLLEWHFNIFSLPESEYINKATLKNNT